MGFNRRRCWQWLAKPFHQLVDFTSNKQTIGLVHQVHLVELLIRNHLRVVTVTAEYHIHHKD
ncbi:hypothetical protein [Paenibacillus sp. H1-7]|uniref:hypothetical protein n=1 Tax=Paenibacillus sp. H1-7 TaxID=2282849 RepID=UPI001EF8E5CA|nr:hypothetical protein [Paenibacillus sp. H1-7]